MNPIGNFIAPINTRLTDTQREQAIYVSGIIRDIFGINGLIYFPSELKQSIEPPDYLGIQMMPGDEPEQMSYLGTSVVGTVEFCEGEYNTYDHSGRVVKKKMRNFMLPYSCIVEFSRTAVLTQTRTLGANGTVKELYGLDDWKINIRGIALNDTTNPNAPTAHQIIEELAQWRKVCDSIAIRGGLFESKDIHNITIDRLDIQPIEGKYNVIPFQIEALSDEPIELMIP